ncbi:MAG: hypothetical protein ACP5RH_03660 [Leptodesmis sp.]|uniref:hypothetical protein n=1 Tax=Leptodesmis sp. TaxID=3100501 RepID=UPI003D09E3CE
MSYLTVDYVIHLLTIAGCSFCAVVLTGFFGWSFWSTAREGIRYLRRLHQVPCHRCQYFTGEHLLKCTVHPCKAFSEGAIDCLDFAPVGRTRVSAPKCDRYKRTRLK